MTIASVRHEFSESNSEFTYNNYSEFMVKRLHEFVKHEFCICMQWDSCIIDNSKWTEDFFNYDYIGAVWQNAFVNRVGNGGFSLRSQKFLEESAKLDYIKTDNPIANNEDIVSCVINYEKMVAAGVKFAPISLAKQFSVERPIPEFPHDYDNISTYKSFAFHGQFFINYQQVATIPVTTFNATISPYGFILNSAAAAKTFDVDYFGMDARIGVR
jgi:hypothetical protein